MYGESRRDGWCVSMNLTVAITGASGAVFGREMLRALEADERVARVHFVASENSLRVMAEELGVAGRTNLLEKLLGVESDETHPSRKDQPQVLRLAALAQNDNQLGDPDSEYLRSENPDLHPTDEDLSAGTPELGHPNSVGRSDKTVQHSDADIGAAIASGSHPSNGMIILPCSMGTLAAIAQWPGQLADCPRRRRDAQGAATADSLCARDALQSHSSAKYDAGRRGRRGDLSLHSGLL